MSDKDQATKPMLFVAPNGPVILMTDPTPLPVDNLVGEDGRTFAKPHTVSLCRCGGSESKPFCDGTHGQMHFSDRKETDGRLDKRKNYAGRGIIVHDNRSICSHSGICVDRLPRVFDKSRRPWIDAMPAEAREIIAVVEACPSGALSYSIGGVERRDYGREPLMTVNQDGPYCLVGGIEVVGFEPRAEEVSTEHCTVCRCGSSKNKPFCDGTHGDIGFKDPK